MSKKAVLLFFLAAFSWPAAAEQLTLLANGETADWEYQAFKNIAQTQYQKVVDESGRGALAAHSRSSASGYTREIDISLYETPWLYFRWRVDEAAANDAEKTRNGDDFAWRLYFVGKRGLRYKSLSVVYSRNAAVDSRWDSPYAGFIHDLKIYAGASYDEDALGQWQTSVINVGALWREMFDDEGKIGLVGIMTDGDNRAVDMRAYYGDIILSSEAL